MKLVSFFSYLIVFFLTSGCVGRKTHQANHQTYPPYDPTSGALSEETPVTSGPTQDPLPELKERPGITLVVGGAGVASFATVGILKKFKEDGIRIERIVATGWPALFALGYGFMKSVHDLEWFAMRLTEKDFKFSRGLFGSGGERLSKAIETALNKSDLGEAKTPVLIATGNTGESDLFVYDSGDWKPALLQTMNMPGIYRDFPEELNKLRAIAVDEAARRGGNYVVAFDMYEDFLKATLASSGKDAEVRKDAVKGLRNSLKEELPLAQQAGKIVLGRPSDDLNAKRAAIQAGYKEAAKLSKQIKAALK